MKTIKFLILTTFVIVVVLPSAVFAQGGDPIEPLDLAGEPVILEFNTGAAGPPSVEPLTDGRLTFRIMAAGEVSGAFEGSISVQVSEVTPLPPPPFHPTTVMFTIETEQGELAGYYVASLHHPDGADTGDVSGAGQILSVSGVYADLYLADVVVSSQVQYVDGRGVGESGTMTISAR